jgi:hypothetical protein
MEDGACKAVFCRQLRKDVRIREENGVEQGLKTGYRQPDLYMHASRDHLGASRTAWLAIASLGKLHAV